MYKLLIFTALFGLSMAGVFQSAPRQQTYSSHASSHSSHGASSDDVHAETKVFHSDVRHNGFDYALETTNGIHAIQSGDDHGNLQGDYEYISPEGVHVKVVYVADENGYQPQSDLLPTPPPIPDAILRSLEYIRTHPPAEEHYSAPVGHHAPAPVQSHHRGSAFGRHH